MARKHNGSEKTILAALGRDGRYTHEAGTVRGAWNARTRSFGRLRERAILKLEAAGEIRIVSRESSTMTAPGGRRLWSTLYVVELAK